MTDHTTVRNAIAAVMATVPDIGVIHAYERYAAREADMLALYQHSNGQIRGWHIRRIRQREQSPAIGRWVARADWRIRGYMALQDATQSELAFDGLLDALITAFRTDETLGDVVTATVFPERAGLQVEDSGPVMFAGVLCHSAQLLLTTEAIY